MREYRETLSISIYPSHKKVLAIWQDQTGMKASEILRWFVEEFSDHRFQREGFDWQLVPPKWRTDV